MTEIMLITEGLHYYNYMGEIVMVRENEERSWKEEVFLYLK